MLRGGDGSSRTASVSASQTTTTHVFSKLGFKINSDASLTTKPAYQDITLLQPQGPRPIEIQQLPLRARHEREYKKETANGTKSAHEVDIVQKNGKRRFLKHNTNEKDPSLLMSQLEAVCAGFYKLLIPDHVPSTRPVYNDKYELMKVCSDAIENFKSIIDDPLKEADLKIRSLDEGLLSIEMLEKLDQWAACANVDLTVPVEDDWTISDDTDLKVDADEDSFIIDDEEQTEKEAYCQKINAKIGFCRDWFENAKIDPNDPKKVLIHDLIKNVSQDLINFRIVKGLALCLVASFIFEEDDLHRKNMSKNGKRIDFDMSLWNILYDYKYMSGSLFDRYLRSVSSSSSGMLSRIFNSIAPGNRFDTDADEIDSLPNFKKSQPFYWPTTGQVPEFLLLFLPGVFVPENAFTPMDNKIFSLLEKHPVFIYYKFRTLLKYILTDPDMYRDVVKLNMNENLTHAAPHIRAGEKIIDTFANHQAVRIEYFEKILLEMPTFKSFILEHGERAFKEVRQEFAARQNHLHLKAENNPEYEQFATDRLDDIDEKFARIRAYVTEGCYVKFADGEASAVLRRAISQTL